MFIQRSSLSTASGDHRRATNRSEEHTSLQSRLHLVCRLLLEKKKKRRGCSCGAGAASTSSSATLCRSPPAREHEPPRTNPYVVCARRAVMQRSHLGARSVHERA